MKIFQLLHLLSVTLESYVLYSKALHLNLHSRNTLPFLPHQREDELSMEILFNTPNVEEN